jgi:predicted nuclease with RNAse H fold
VRTLGIDLSSQAKNTAACTIEWRDGAANIVHLVQNVDDGAATDLMQGVEKVGIDIPLAWPIAFADAVSKHSHGGVWPADYVHADTSAFRYRRTDLAVWRDMGIPPLSVSTDRIGIPAMRAASLMSKMSPAVARDGSGLVVEVYPAATLRRWGFASRQYKGAKRATERAALVADFVLRVGGWLAVSNLDRELCEESDDALDAVIAALVARAAAVGLVDPIPDDDQEAARREGWIAIPLQDSLGRLPAH